MTRPGDYAKGIIAILIAVGFALGSVYDLGYRTAQAACKPQIKTEIPKTRLEVKRFANYYRRSL